MPRRRSLAMLLFRPDIEHFLCLLLFCLVSTLGFVLWSYEDRLFTGPIDRRLAQDAAYEQAIESFIADGRRMMEERAARFPEFPDVELEREVPDVLDRHRRKGTESPVVKVDGVLKRIDKSFKSKRQKKQSGSKNRKSNPTNGLAKDIHGGEAFCSVYYTKSNISDSFECIKMKFKPPVQICLYPDSMDVHVSRHLRKDGVWEPHILRHYQNLLYHDPALGVYDIGAHVGQYSLLAASMGRLVVAVEPHPPSQRRLHKAIKLGKLEDKIILVTNAVSDRRDTLELSIPEDNQGGVGLTSQDADRFCTEPECPPHATTIIMDDLLEVTNFEKAIIKIDIEGHEHRAFVQSRRLFQTVDIQFIIMEWIKLREHYQHEAHDSPDKRLVFELIDYLVDLGFTPRGSLLLNRLDPQFWYGWPDDVFWEAEDRTTRTMRKNSGRSAASFNISNMESAEIASTSSSSSTTTSTTSSSTATTQEQALVDS